MAVSLALSRSAVSLWVTRGWSMRFSQHFQLIIWSENRTLAGRGFRADGGLCRRLSCVSLSGSDGGAGDQLAGFGVGLGCQGLDGDFVAEALEAADVGARAVPGALELLVVAGAEVAVFGLGVGQEGVGDDELVSHDGALGFLFRHPGAQAPVLGAEEGLGAPGSGGGLAEGAADVGVTASGGVLPLARPADSRTRGASRAQEHRCPAVGKAVMSVPISPIRSWAVLTPKPGTP